MMTEFDPEHFGAALVNSMGAARLRRDDWRRRQENGRQTIAKMRAAGLKWRWPSPPNPKGNGVARLRSDLIGGEITADEVLSLSCRPLGRLYRISFKEAAKWQQRLRATGVV